MIFSDSLSTLEVISGRNLKYSELLDFLVKFTQQKSYDIVLAWVPGHVSIRGNEIADAVAKEATSKGLITSILPFSDLKPKIHSYTHAPCQKDWDEQVDNKTLRNLPFTLRKKTPPISWRNL